MYVGEWLCVFLRLCLYGVFLYSHLYVLHVRTPYEAHATYLRMYDVCWVFVCRHQHNETQCDLLICHVMPFNVTFGFVGFCFVLWCIYFGIRYCCLLCLQHVKSMYCMWFTRKYGMYFTYVLYVTCLSACYILFVCPRCNRCKCLYAMLSDAI